LNPVQFSRRTSALLSQAEALCAARGVRLTELRRHVLGLVLDSERPAGAYDMLERLRPNHKGAAPPTIYRALEFLLEQGLIHKVERLSAFVGCVHGMDEHGHDGSHNAQFLICTQCGRVAELDDHSIGHSLQQAATAIGFKIDRSIVEADGLCAACIGEPG
jgi:Fur family zinc uptake transcriptional regulator